MRYLTVGLLAGALFLAAACSDDDAPAEGPLTIETATDFTARPVVGTFEVTEGADTLGCSSGTFVDEFVSEDNISKVMTCDDGPNEGSFTAAYTLEGEDAGPGDDNGAWSIAESSGDFVGLEGAGDFSVAYSSTGHGVETFTGDIEYTS
jgi:hypothetical protein